MPSSRPRQRFCDIVENIDAICEYTQGMSVDDYGANRLVRDAVERCFMRISEAATKLGTEAEALAPNQPWRQIRDLGNQIKHGYDGVDDKLIFNLIGERTDSLRADAIAAIAKLDTSHQAHDC